MGDTHLNKGIWNTNYKEVLYKETKSIYRAEGRGYPKKRKCVSNRRDKIKNHWWVKTGKVVQDRGAETKDRLVRLMQNIDVYRPTNKLTTGIRFKGVIMNLNEKIRIGQL